MEMNFDGLVGPSHNYGGLSFGNIASEKNEGSLSNPREAALQGLAKMRALYDLGVPQAVIPPHVRPDLGLARRLGFDGDDGAVLSRLLEEAPLVLAACYSASAMWTANAATVSASADAADGKVHFTPANLQNKVHRSIEPPTTGRILRTIFSDSEHFAHHPPLPGTAALGDEGAANHTRFAARHDGPGVHLFVYGESAVAPWEPRPRVFPARQTKEASQAIVRLHQIPEDRVVFAHQNPDAIDRGVFHNDVISVGHLDVFLVHEEAFLEQDALLDDLRARFLAVTGSELRIIVVPSEAVSVDHAVASYLFNSQLVTSGAGEMVLVAPKECEEQEEVRTYIDGLVEGSAPIDAVRYFDLRQSMQGGGGPACLRLRVPMTESEVERIAPGVRFSPELHAALEGWVRAHYPDELAPSDLADVAFVRQCREALDVLTQILRLGPVYAFQDG